VVLNEQGGIIDDTVITKHASDAFYMVTNAGRRDRDLAWFSQKLEEWNASEKGKGGPVEIQVLDNWGLLALQGMFRSFCPLVIIPLTTNPSGPEAASYLQTLTSYDLRGLTFGKSAFVPIEGFNLHVSRGGYTGEDGFEVRYHNLSFLILSLIPTNATPTSHRFQFRLHKLSKWQSCSLGHQSNLLDSARGIAYV
jgi:aminomethyltransferase